MKICSICKEEAVFYKKNYYVHKNGGIYKQYCSKCGWSGDKEGSYGYCPSCKNLDVRDNHCIQVVDSE